MDIHRKVSSIDCAITSREFNRSRTRLTFVSTLGMRGESYNLFLAALVVFRCRALMNFLSRPRAIINDWRCLLQTLWEKEYALARFHLRLLSLAIMQIAVIGQAANTLKGASSSKLLENARPCQKASGDVRYGHFSCQTTPTPISQHTL